MKKLLSIVIAVAVMAIYLPTTFATDICAAEPLTVRNFNAEITSAVHLRTVSCMMESTVITTLSGGEVVLVIGTTEGWHKVRRADGAEGWIWETFLSPTSKVFNPSTTPEPEPEPEPYVAPEPVTYEAMRDIVGHKYEDAIWYVYNNEIVQGYEDGSYKPDQNINRAELLKIIVESYYTQAEFGAYEGQNCFSDVYATAWYSNYVCFAQAQGLVEGYGDGSFRPANEVNFVEALKIVLLGVYAEEEIPAVEAGDPWYKGYVNFASNGNFIPLDVDKFDDMFNRGQMAEMITRILKGEDGTLVDYLGAMSDSKITYEMLEY